MSELRKLELAIEDDYAGILERKRVGDYDAIRDYLPERGIDWPAEKVRELIDYVIRRNGGSLTEGKPTRERRRRDYETGLYARERLMAEVTDHERLEQHREESLLHFRYAQELGVREADLERAFNEAHAKHRERAAKKRRNEKNRASEPQVWRRLRESAKKPAMQEGPALPHGGFGFHTKSGERSKWLWEDRIPLGDVTVIAGRDGSAKSTLAMWLCAELSHGLLPGEFEGKPTHSFYAIGEDNAERLALPRLEAAGADLAYLKGAVQPAWTWPGSQWNAGVPSYEWMKDYPLVVLDPAQKFLTDFRTGRKGIDALVTLAREHDIAILLVHHFRGTIDPANLHASFAGGYGFMASQRSRFAMGPITSGRLDDTYPNANALYGLIHVKNTYGEETDPMVFEREQVPNPYEAKAGKDKTLPRLKPLGEYGITGRDLYGREHRGKIEEAVAIIRRALAESEDGMVPSAEVEERVLAAGIATRTYKAARARLKQEGWAETEKIGDAWYIVATKVPDAPPAE